MHGKRYEDRNPYKVILESIISFTREEAQTYIQEEDMLYCAHYKVNDEYPH